MSPEEILAAQQTLQAQIDECYKDDPCKLVSTPFISLGKMMVERIPFEKLNSCMLVVSDLGFAVALKMRLRKYNYGLNKVTFVAHTEKVATKARELGYPVVLVPYEKRDLFFSAAGEYTCLKDMKFDAIVGNPPFNPPVEKGTGGGTGSGQMIWPKFIILALNLLKEDGDLLFITPSNWRDGSPGNKCKKQARDLMWQRGLCWFEDVRKPIDYFQNVGRSINMDAWHVSSVGPHVKIPSSLKTRGIVHSSPEIMKKLNNFFEICDNSPPIEIRRDKPNSEPLYNKLKETDVPVEEGLWPYANTSAQYLNDEYDWYDKEPETYHLKKVIVSDSGAFAPTYFDGMCGVGRHAYAYIVSSKQEGMQLISNLESLLWVAENLTPKGNFSFPIHLYQRLPKALLTKPWQEVFGENS